jgi:hypothetical protein
MGNYGTVLESQQAGEIHLELDTSLSGTSFLPRSFAFMKSLVWRNHIDMSLLSVGGMMAGC